MSRLITLALLATSLSTVATLPACIRVGLGGEYDTFDETGAHSRDDDDDDDSDTEAADTDGFVIDDSGDDSDENSGNESGDSDATGDADDDTSMIEASLEQPVPTRTCATPEASACALEVALDSDGMLDLGTGIYACSVNEREVTLRNTSREPLLLRAKTKPRKGPPHISVASIAPHPEHPGFPSVVAPGEAYRVLVRAHAEAVGAHTNTLTISDDGGCCATEVPLRSMIFDRARVTDEFQALGIPKTDILFVVSNTAVMGAFVDVLVPGYLLFKQYADSRGDIDYQIGVVSADVASDGEPTLAFSPGLLYPFRGERARIITRQTENSTDAFVANLTFDGNYDIGKVNAPLEAMRLALSETYLREPWANGGFRRPGASLEVFVVTAEDDASPGSVDQYIDVLKASVPNGDPASDDAYVSFTVVAGATMRGNPTRAESCTLRDTSAEPANRLMQVYNEIDNGIALSICDADAFDIFGGFPFERFRARSAFPLSQPADPSSIVTTINDQVIPQDTSGIGTGWTFDLANNWVVFGKNTTPPRLSRIRVTYRALGCE